MFHELLGHSDECFQTCKSSVYERGPPDKGTSSLGTRSESGSLTLSSSLSNSETSNVASIYLASLQNRIDNLEESVNDSLNMLTDRLNQLESDTEFSKASNDSKVSGIQDIIKQLFTKLVRKLINILQTSQSSRTVHSRIGMQRAHQTTPRE